MAKGIITTKYLESLGVESEIAAQIFAERGKEIAETNATIADLENQIAESKETISKLNAEFENLKAENASGAEWKTRYETLQAEIETKAKQAEADRILKEKDARNREYFNTALSEIGKSADDFNGKFTMAGYYNEFVKAIEDEANAGKAHKDVLKNLVKDDKYAFKGVTISLAGGKPSAGGSELPTKKEFDKMSYKERLKLFDENPALYDKLSNKE